MLELVIDDPSLNERDMLLSIFGTHNQ